MELPEDIENQIADYLNLEFGESFITKSDFGYLGEQGATHYWQLNEPKDKYWVSVEPYMESWLISLSTIKPTI